MDLSGGLSELEAKRFYDRYGTKLDLSDAFEGRAKARALALLEPRVGEVGLEVGVGCGHFLADAVSAVGDAGLVVGLDVSETMLALSRARAPAAALLRANAVRTPLADASVDWVFSTYVLDLMPYEVIAQVLVECRRVVQPEGRLVLCSLTEGESLLERAFMGAWKAIRGWAPARVGGCRPLRLAEHVERAGWRIEQREHVGQLGTPSEVLRCRIA